MTWGQHEWWKTLRDYLDQILRFFSDDGRDEREKAPVREFLKYLGVQFTEDELTVPPKADDGDVRFQDARFQNVERMEEGRRRPEEIRRFAEQARTARDVAALEVGRPYSVPMGVAELLRKVLPALQKRTRETVNRAKLDALVYVNLPGRHLHPVPEFIEGASAVARLGWRSVSVLWPPYAVVMCVNPAAPKFLRAKARRIIVYPGTPWEDEAVSAKPTAIAHLAVTFLATSAAAGYVVLGALVLATRAMRDVIGALGTRCAGEAWLVEAESATPGD